MNHEKPCLTPFFFQTLNGTCGKPNRRQTAEWMLDALEIHLGAVTNPFVSTAAGAPAPESAATTPTVTPSENVSSGVPDVGAGRDDDVGGGGGGGAAADVPGFSSVGGGGAGRGGGTPASMPSSSSLAVCSLLLEGLAAAVAFHHEVCFEPSLSRTRARFSGRVVVLLWLWW